MKILNLPLKIKTFVTQIHTLLPICTSNILILVLKKCFHLSNLAILNQCSGYCRRLSKFMAQSVLKPTGGANCLKAVALLGT